MNNIEFLGFVSMPGGMEWIIIGLVVLLIFGAKRLPELAKGMGKSIKEFKKAASEVEEQLNSTKDDVKKVIDNPYNGEEEIKEKSKSKEKVK